MSLINDMLKDLDNDAKSRADEPLPTGLKTQAAKPAGKRGWVLPAIAGLAVVYVLVVELNLFGLMPEKSAPPVEIPKPIALDSKWLEQSPTLAAEPVALEKVTPEPQVAISEDSVQIPAVDSDFAAAPTEAYPAEESESVAAEISAVETRSAAETLLQAGDAALRQNRLTTPTGDNAYQYFKSVLLLQPDNPQALAGVAQIQGNYVAWLEQALAAGRVEVARQYWLKARNTGVDAEVLAQYQQRLDAAVVNPGTSSAIETPPVKKSDGTALSLTDDASAAARLARDGLVLGENRALQWLEQGTSADQTAVVLADFYAALPDLSKLAYLQQLLSERGSNATIYAQAQLTARRQNFALAAEQLAAVEFTGPAEERRLRTLAGFYQKLKDYARALPLYSRLVNLPSAGVNDWLGLAVSADAQRNTGVALNAYRNVLQLNHPDSRIMGFARQRYQDLSFSSSR